MANRAKGWNIKNHRNQMKQAKLIRNMKKKTKEEKN